MRVVVIILLILFAGGCTRSRDERTADGRVVVHYWEKWTGFEGEAMQAVVDDFNHSQNRVFVEKLTVSQIDQKMMLATAGGNPPDVAGLWSHSINMYAEKNALTPLNRLLEEAGIKREQYIPVFWDLCAHRGFMWGLPSTPASVALHWNKKLFREAGLDPDKPPRSIAELDKMAEKLTIVEVMRGGVPVRVRFTELTPEEKAAKDFEIVQLGHSPAEPGWYTPMWGYWFGGRLWDGSSRVTITSDENLRAFRWYQSYPRKYGVENLRRFGAASGNFSSPQNPFLAGRVAMELQGVWMYNFIDRYAPNLEWGAAPFPSDNEQKLPGVTVVETDVLVIPRGAPHVKEAFEFIRYVNTQAEMEKLVLGQRKFSPLARMSDDFIRRHPNPYIGVFIDLAKSPNARFVPRMPVWNEYSDELVVASNQIFSLKATPEEALAHVQDRVQWKLDRVLRRWDLVKEARMKEWTSSLSPPGKGEEP